jgi:putative zinc finger protein
MDEDPNETAELPGPCRRARLLLSFLADAAATPSQEAELAEHLPTCAACRRSRAVDGAVRARLLERADAPAPAWLEGFGERTAARAAVQLRETRTQNRLLWTSAAAAVLVALAAEIAPRRPATDAMVGSAREATAAALIRHEIAHGRK